MKNIWLLTLIIGLIFLDCARKQNSNNATIKQTDRVNTTVVPNDKEKIQNLIRHALHWANSKNTIDVLPVLTDAKDSIYVGFDLKKHKENLEKLKKTDFFATEFIDNYNHIILTLDKKLRNKEYDQWFVGELPTFTFANDVDPWCLCQDNLAWDSVKVNVIKIQADKGELNWKWGNLNADTDQSWKDFSYKFRVVKENKKWKISYLQGFDFKESTQ